MTERSALRGFGHGHLAIGSQDLFLFLHTAQAPPPEEFAKAVAAFQELDAANGGDIARLAFFVVTDGGHPDVSQRAEHSRFLGGRALRTAVITEQALVRGTVGSISWFNPAAQLFSPQHVGPALAHVGLARADLPALLDALGRIQADMDPVRALAALVRFAG